MRSVVEDDDEVVFGVETGEEDDELATAASFAMMAKLSTPGAKAWRLLQGSPATSFERRLVAVSGKSDACIAV